MTTRDISDRIKLLRNQLGISQKDAAARLGVAFSTYQKYEYGQFPSRRNIGRLLDLFGCNEVWLLTGEGAPFEGEDAERPPTSHQERPRPETEIVLARQPVGVEYDDHKEDQEDEVGMLLGMTEEILLSDTTYSRALAENIKAFHAAVVDTRSVETRLAQVEAKLARLEAIEGRLDRLAASAENENQEETKKGTGT